MPKSPTIFLKLAVFLIGIAILALCVFFAVAVVSRAEWSFIPVLLIMYAAAIPFFLALYQAFKLLSYIDKGQAFSNLSVHALRNIKYCATAISTLYLAGMPFMVRVAEKDYAPGATGIIIVIIFASVVVATFAALLQKLLQEALAIKSENDLTI